MQSSFSAQFTLDKTHYEVLSCEYVFYQDTDTLGNAVGLVRSGELELVLKGSNDTQLLGWAADPLIKRSGEVVFFQGDNPAGVYEKLSFSGGSCVVYTELFEPGNTQEGSYVYQFKIVANQLVLNGITHSNGWLGYQ